MEEKELYRENVRPQFHFTTEKGWIGGVIGLDWQAGQWHLRYEHRELGSGEPAKRAGYATSKDLIHWHEAEANSDGRHMAYTNAKRPLESQLIELPVDGNRHQLKWLRLYDNQTYELGQFIEQRFIAETARMPFGTGWLANAWTLKEADKRCILVGTGHGNPASESPSEQLLLIPTELKLRTTEQGIRLQAMPVHELERLRIWHRRWSGVDVHHEQRFAQELQFRIAPGEWPDIRILPADNYPDAITSDLLDVELALEAEADTLLDIELYGIGITVDMSRQQLQCQGVTVPLPAVRGTLTLRMLLDTASLELFACEGEAIMSVAARPDYAKRTIQLQCPRGRVSAAAIEVFGLRGIWPKPEARQLIQDAAEDDTVVYRSNSYTIFNHRIEDAVYGEPPAYVPDRNTIVSPTRVIEDFVWRDTEWNDMTRVIDRDSVWHPRAEIASLPDLHTGHATIDAAYRLASDIFYRCGSAEFALQGEVGMWTAGQFQGPGEGFGVWVRDTMHVALRSGNILDPEGARRSLLRTTTGGFDNGVDGTAMPIVGIWDYYLATGDLSLVQETWFNLKRRIAKLEESFDTDQGLVRAEQSTSNDAFPEPECGGFSLATEIYFMEAFRAMARMGAYMEEPEHQVKAWTDMGELLLRNIQSQYWNEEAGYYTSGPIGSDSYVHGYWESSGQEMAMWPRYGIATKAQRKSILDRLPEVAMNEFGVNVFPYRQETNHFCNSAWVVWTSGMAAAAGREGRLDLLTTFIAQQVRNGVMNKTFYEVIDFETGKAWRWPGQLWHAAGFISYFYLGVLGMEYEEQGLIFAPAVPEMLRDLHVENLRYRAAQLEIVVHGWGTAFIMKCNGETVTHMPADISGKHMIEFWAVEPGEAEFK
ncbi:GH32 C-terminal domain-containing protein [Paenibacillus sp. R14(2021)]|uniref:alpha-L-rhamnosidase-related protein n=1 Tax=Paenibacillus sp. R14(2021) TaxID=2859228 RepID=UPI001C614AFD|nr:GH32 C-terminal domain-containing protein [Paenibacillus sp. R14(2021)]